MNTHGIYVDLDSLLDTRLSTLYVHRGADYVKSVLDKRDNYFKRQQDEFEGCSKADFRNLYERRDKFTLKQAGRTEVLVFIKGIVLQAISKQNPEAVGTKPKLFLNTYPYKLTEQEDMLFLRLLMELTDKKCDIEIIHKDNKDLSLVYAKQNFKVMFMYDYSRWLEAHAESFKTFKMPDVELYGPAIYFGRVPTKEEEAEFKVTKKDAFTLMELGSCMYIGLKLIPVSFFSLNLV